MHHSSLSTLYHWLFIVCGGVWVCVSGHSLWPFELMLSLLLAFCAWCSGGGDDNDG